MTRLTKLLEYYHAGNVKRSQIANEESFKTLVLDTLNKSQKELIISNADDSSTLLQESVYDKIVEGAKGVRCARDAFPIVNIGDHQMRVTYASGGNTFAEDVAEGAAIPLNESNFYTKTITPKKIGIRPLITSEMIEDELWDMVEWHLLWAGRAIEAKLNRDCVDDFIAGTQQTIATGAGTLATLVVNRGTLQTAGYNPDTCIIAPGYEQDLLAEVNFTYAGRFGDPSNKTLRTGVIQNVLGMDFYRLSMVSNGTNTWDAGFDTAGDYGCLMFDSKAPFMMIGMKRDISIEKYDDPIHDLVGISATMRYGTGVIQPKAGVAVKFS
jgi:hypothetical protein